MENGTLTLIGATTENPYFEVNKALVSRARLFRLQPLEPEDLRQLIDRALSDPEHGYGQRRVRILPEAADHLLNVAGGDARSLLNALELAVETTPLDGAGEIVIDLAIAEESIQQRAVLYDKQRLHQIDPRLRCRRHPVLAGPDAGGGGEPALHPAAAADLRR